jgi:hypothetical protein
VGCYAGGLSKLCHKYVTYVFMVWYIVKAQGLTLSLCFFALNGRVTTNSGWTQHGPDPTVIPVGYNLNP